MTAETILSPLSDLLKKAHHLKQLADAEDWVGLDEHAKLYQASMVILQDDAFLQAIANANLIEEAKNIIIEIQQFNTFLDIHITDQRDQIASELRQAIQSEKAMDAYRR